MPKSRQLRPARKPAPVWYEDAIRLMLEEPTLSLPDAVAALGIPASVQDCLRHKRTRAWREAWERLSREWQEHQASPAVHTKAALVGRMKMDAEHLRRQGDFARAAEVESRIARVEGWTGPETTTNIFNDLSGSDFAALRAALAATERE